MGEVNGMEHRQRERNPVMWLAAIHCNGIVQGIGIVKNASMRGLFVESNCNIHIHNKVKIELLSANHLFSENHLRGCVIHTSRNGFGLVFNDLQDPNVVVERDRTFL